MALDITSHKTSIQSAGHKGRGVFASQPISSCEVIEIAPVIVLDSEDLVFKLCNESMLAEYVYGWSEEDGEEDEAIAIALGHASLYNTHDDDDPNASFDINLLDRTITISALRDIKPGEEITISYGDEEEESSLHEDLVDICQSVADFKQNSDSESLQSDVLKIQEALHQLTLDHPCVGTNPDPS